MLYILNIILIIMREMNWGRIGGDEVWIRVVKEGWRKDNRFKRYLGDKINNIFDVLLKVIVVVD